MFDIIFHRNYNTILFTQKKNRSLKITFVRDTFFLNVDLARWLFTLAIYNWNIRFLVSKCQKVLVDPRPNSD